MAVEPPDPARQPDENWGTIYRMTSDHWSHAEQVRWTLLYNYFMGSSVLVLAWAALFVSLSHSQARCVLIALAAAGGLVSLLWLGLGHRANRFVDMYRRAGQEAEWNVLGDLAANGPFARAEAHRSNPSRWRRVRTDIVLVCVPVIFFALYFVMFLLSLGA